MTPLQRRQYRANKARREADSLRRMMREHYEGQPARRAAWEAEQGSTPQPTEAMNEADAILQEEALARQQRKGFPA